MNPAGDLQGSTRYDVTVASDVTDLAGNSLAAGSRWTFTTQAVAISLTDTFPADFAAGTGAQVTRVGNGDVMLPPTCTQEFDGTTLPGGWSAGGYNGTPNTSVSSGALHVDATQYTSVARYGPGTTMEAEATFTLGEPFEGVGYFAAPSPWAMFAMDSTGLHLGVNANGTVITWPGADNLIGSPHRYRIEWTSTSVRYFIDGDTNPVVSTVAPPTGSMSMDAQDYGPANGSFLHVEWIHTMPYSTPAVFTSRVFDASGPSTWQTLGWTADQPTGTTLAIRARAGNGTLTDVAWSDPLTSGAALTGLNGRFIQYQATLTTADPNITPLLRDVTLSGVPTPNNTPPVIDSVVVLPPSPTTNDLLTSVVEAHDADNDTITLHYQWIRNGVPITGETGALLDLSLPDRGDHGNQIAVIVPDDGTVEGTPLTSQETTVNDTPRRSPIPGTQTSVEGALVSVQVVAADLDGDGLSYAASGLPTGVSIDTSRGLISGTISFTAAGSHAVTVSVTDGTATAVVDNFTWTITTPTGLRSLPARA